MICNHNYNEAKRKMPISVTVRPIVAPWPSPRDEGGTEKVKVLLPLQESLRSVDERLIKLENNNGTYGSHGRERPSFLSRSNNPDSSSTTSGYCVATFSLSPSSAARSYSCDCGSLPNSIDVYVL